MAKGPLPGLKNNMKETRRLPPIARMTPKEREIWQLALKLDEEYFRDMRFETKKLKNLLTYYMEDENKKMRKAIDDLPGWENLNLFDWVIKIRKRRKYLGACDKKRKTIYIYHKLKGEELKTTLLHELIHYYEGVLLESYRQVLLLYFYEKILKKIGRKKFWLFIRFDKFFLELSNKPQFHTVLFLLKSLDLDLRLKLPFGTINSYGREEFFNRR